MLLFSSIILGLVVTFLASTCYQVMNAGALFSKAKSKNPFAAVAANEWVISLALGLIAGIGNYFASKVTLGVAVIFLIVELIVMLMICLTAHGSDNGYAGCSTIGEYAPFVLLELLFGLTAMGAAARISEFITNPFWASLVAGTPAIAFTIIIISFIVGYFKYRYELHDDNQGLFGFLAIAAAVLGLAFLIWLIVTRVDFASLKKQPEPEIAVIEETKPEPETVAEVAELEEAAPSYHFFNLDLQDGDADDDFNFGFDRYSAAVTAFENSHSEEDEETFIKNWLIADFKESLEQDPALAAADLAYADSILGTRFMGVFYESAKQDWAQAINDAKETFADDSLTWQLSTTAFFGMLETAEPSVDKISQKVTDQMYMNPYVSDPDKYGPDVIVMETTDQTGHLLVFSFKIKGNTFKLGYRTECGYQPVNVADVMKIKAQPNPTAKKSVSPTPTKTPSPTPTPNPSPSPTPNPRPTPDPDPDPDPKYNKDKTKGTQGDIVAPNDNKGPGEDTNNGVGAKESTKDQPTNSNKQTYTEYRETIKELEQAQDQTPDVVPASGTHVDDNSAKGTGNGGIDTPTPVNQSTTTTDGHKLSDDKATGQWDGPVD